INTARKASAQWVWVPACAGTTRESLRGAARRHDLVSRLAGQLRHVVELARVAAHAGRRRTHLDDEIADFRFRHQRPHHVPAVPGFARVEAEKLAAASGDDAVDLAGPIPRTHPPDL